MYRTRKDVRNMRKQIQAVAKVYACPLNLKYRCEEFVSGYIFVQTRVLKRNAISSIKYEDKYIKEKLSSYFHEIVKS